MELSTAFARGEDSPLLDESSRRSHSPSSVMLRSCVPHVHAVAITGALTHNFSADGDILERSRPCPRTIRALILNRPASLHALSARMIEAIARRISILESQPIPAVLLTATTASRPTFCAGGDIRAMIENTVKSGSVLVDNFFRMEFWLNAFMSRMRTPVLSIMDGLTMGGGAGLAMHGRFRVATDRTVFAMPECAIGLTPDVGASYFLSRVSPPELGMYMALTGARLTGANVKAAGIATHFVSKGVVEALVNRLETAMIYEAEDVESILHEFEADQRTELRMTGIGVIRECFKTESLESIISNLERFVECGQEEDAKFATTTLSQIRKGCPTSVRISFQSQKRGATMSLDECLRMEFRLVARCVRREDYRNGVTAMVVTKDKNPQWKPDNINDITDKDVEMFFAPLSDDLAIPELDIHQKLSHSASRKEIHSRL